MTDHYLYIFFTSKITRETVTHRACWELEAEWHISTNLRKFTWKEKTEMRPNREIRSIWGGLNKMIRKTFFFIFYFYFSDQKKLPSLEKVVLRTIWLKRNMWWSPQTKILQSWNLSLITLFSWTCRWRLKKWKLLLHHLVERRDSGWTECRGKPVSSDDTIYYFGNVP